MASWHDLEEQEPEFVARVAALLDARKHKTIATLRRLTGRRASPASRWSSRTASSRSAPCRPPERAPISSVTPASPCTGPRFDPPEGNPSGWPGEAKVAGRAVLVGDLEGDTPGQLFRADLDEVVLTKLTDAGDRLLIEVWRPGAPLRRIERD